jgi:uncharacterized protein YkwD
LTANVTYVPSHRAHPDGPLPRRAYLAAGAVIVLVVVAVVVARIAYGGAGPARTDATDASRQSCAAGAVSGTCSSPTRTATPSPTVTSSAAPSAPAPTTPAPSSTATTSAPASPSVSAAASAVLALINQARAQDGLPAYTVTSGLELSSSRHNQLMADGCGLSHQCPGEPPLGDRETAAGVHWTAAGENIGEGGPVADTSAAITQMAVALTQDMLNEKPPDDGHRLNILSSTFTHIGITVQRSANGTVWMTQDFSN